MNNKPNVFRDFAGDPVHECNHCGAKIFEDEIIKGNESNHYCCHHGVIPLDLMKVTIPKILKDILLKQTNEGKEFRKNIRKYNNLFAFTSMKANVDHELASLRNGIYTFRISGVLHHYIPMNILPPNESMKPKFAQIYFYDKDFQLTERCSWFKGLCKETIRKLQEMIHEKSNLLTTFPGLTHFSEKNVDEITFQLKQKKKRE